MHKPWSALPPPDGEQSGCMHASACFLFFKIDSSCFCKSRRTFFASDSPFKEDGDANGDVPSWPSVSPVQLAVAGQLPPGSVNGAAGESSRRHTTTTTMSPSSNNNHHHQMGRNRRSPRCRSRRSDSRRMVWRRTGSTIGFIGVPGSCCGPHLQQGVVGHAPAGSMDSCKCRAVIRGVNVLCANFENWDHYI